MLTLFWWLVSLIFVIYFVKGLLDVWITGNMALSGKTYSSASFVLKLTKTYFHVIFYFQTLFWTESETIIPKWLETRNSCGKLQEVYWPQHIQSMACPERGLPNSDLAGGYPILVGGTHPSPNQGYSILTWLGYPHPLWPGQSNPPPC